MLNRSRRVRLVVLLVGITLDRGPRHMVELINRPMFKNLGYLPAEKELRTRGQQFLNLLSAVDPAQGIMRGMSASGRAFDSDLSPEERKAAAIEAALETAVPAGMLGIGALAKQPAKAALMDMLTVTGAPSSVVQEPGVVARGGEPLDPSRRKFMAGLASLPVAAAVAPDILSELGTKGAKVAARASTNALDSAAANMNALKQMILDLEIKREDAVFTDIDDFGTSGRASLKPSEAAQLQKNIDQYDRSIQEFDDEIDISEFELADQMREMFDFIIDDPDVLKGASDDTLETLATEFYENSKEMISSNQIRSMSDSARMPFEELAKEIRRRGLENAKTEQGFNKYSYSKTFAEDILTPRPEARYANGGQVTFGGLGSMGREVL